MAALAAVLLFAAPAHAMIMGADDQTACVTQGGDVHAFMLAHNATVLRIIVPYRGRSNAVACASKAVADGYRVYLTLQYNNRWSPARVAAYFARSLPQYAPYAWAVSVGNEQDLTQGAPAPRFVCDGTRRRSSCRPATAGQHYRAVWNAVEPLLARIAPRAIRVYGEISPFGFTFLQDSYRAGRARGAQAIAFHCYDVKNGGLRIVPQVAAWAARHHLPLWCSEMSAALIRSVHPWLRRDSQAQWNALLASVKAHSPDLKMVSFYRWPQIGAF